MPRSEKSKEFEAEMKNLAKDSTANKNNVAIKGTFNGKQNVSEKRFADLCGYDDTTRGPIPSDR